MARNAGAAVIPQGTGSKWLLALYGLARPTRKTPAAHSQLTYVLTLIRLEIAMAKVAKARRQKKAAPFREVYSARHELLRQELSNGRG